MTDNEAQHAIDKIKAEIERILESFDPSCREAILLQIIGAHEKNPFVCVACNEMRSPPPESAPIVATDGAFVQCDLAADLAFRVEPARFAAT